MNTKTVFDRLQSIDDEVQKLHNTIFALKTTDIQGKILTKKQIYENVWNEEYVYDDDNIMAVISRLRKKIERTAENSYIQTVRGLGYRFNKEL